MLKQLIGTIGLFALSSVCLALSPEAEQGKQVMAACNVCHLENIDPPKGPPYWAIQKRYKMQFPEQEAFMASMTSFVNQPMEDKVLMKGALEHLGMMPPMPLGDKTLTQISAFLYEATFEPPCEHWRIAVRIAKESGDEFHAKKDQNKLNKFCK